MDVHTKKKEIRSKIKKKIGKLSNEYIRENSMIICDKLKNFFMAFTVNYIGAYYPHFKEPDISEFVTYMLKKNINVFLPRTKNDKIKNKRRNLRCTDTDIGTDSICNLSDSASLSYEMARISDLKKDCIPGNYGIPEPNSQCDSARSNELKTMIWLVPGIAFDTKGNRLGRGKGVYDILLSQTNSLKIGIFWQCQKVKFIPSEKHDVPLDIIITEKNIYIT